jgi:hypothetical protein
MGEQESKKSKLWFVSGNDGFRAYLGVPHSARDEDCDPSLKKIFGGRKGFRIDFRSTEIDGRLYYAYSPDNDGRLSDPSEYKKVVDILKSLVEWHKMHGMERVMKEYVPGKFITIHEDDFHKLRERAARESSLAEQADIQFLASLAAAEQGKK